MKTINSVDSLRDAIRILETRREEEKLVMKEQFKAIKHSLRPANLAKQAVYEVTTSADVRKNLVETGIGLLAGYLIKKVVSGSSKHPVKKAMGNILQFAVGNIVSKHSGGLRSKGMQLIKDLVTRKKEPEAQYNGSH